MNDAAKVQMAFQAIEILKQLYCPYLREPLKKAIYDTDTKVDDAIFSVVDLLLGQDCK